MEQGCGTQHMRDSVSTAIASELANKVPFPLHLVANCPCRNPNCLGKTLLGPQLVTQRTLDRLVLATPRGFSDRKSLASGLSMMFPTLVAVGRFGEAVLVIKESCRIFATLNEQGHDSVERALSLLSLATARQMSGQWEQMLATSRDARQAFLKHGNASEAACALGSQKTALDHLKGREAEGLEVARTAYTELLALQDLSRHARTIKAGMASDLADHHLEKGELKEAEALFREAIKEWGDMNELGPMAASVNELGKILVSTGRHAEARHTLLIGHNLASKLNDPVQVALAARNFGRIEESEGDVRAAVQSYDYALALYLKALSTCGSHKHKQISWTDDIEDVAEKIAGCHQKLIVADAAIPATPTYDLFKKDPSAARKSAEVNTVDTPPKFTDKPGRTGKTGKARKKVATPAATPSSAQPSQDKVELTFEQLDLD